LKEEPSDAFWEQRRMRTLNEPDMTKYTTINRLSLTGHIVVYGGLIADLKGLGKLEGPN
jgi:hypothetical protein